MRGEGWARDEGLEAGGLLVASAVIINNDPFRLVENPPQRRGQAHFTSAACAK